MKAWLIVSGKVSAVVAGSRIAVLVFSAVALLFLSCTPAQSFRIPEKLVFDLTWTGIKAGTATQEIMFSGADTRIVSTARSADWVTVFFPVDDRIETVLKGNNPAKLGLPFSNSMKIREGRHRRDKEVRYDHGNRTAYYRDNIKGERQEISIAAATVDTLSSFYFVRQMKLEVGKSVFISILDNKKLWDVEVEVLRREKIKTKLGTFDTIVVKPHLKSEGIMDKRGDMLIWLTDDQRRLPVRMKTKVKIGSITATLVGGTYQ